MGMRMRRLGCRSRMSPFVWPERLLAVHVDRLAVDRLGADGAKGGDHGGKVSESLEQDSG